MLNTPKVSKISTFDNNTPTINPDITAILNKSLNNIDISVDEAVVLFDCNAHELEEVVRVADELRRRAVGY